MKIVIDAGHGLYTAGKRCMKKLDAKETREWFLNDRIADKLERLLADYDCEVIRSDDTTGLTDVSLAKRVEKANNYGADFFLSIHHNAGINGGKGGGTVVYYYGHKEKAQKLYAAVIGETGLVGNRYGEILMNDYYVLKHTKMAALLLENGFMDSATDVPIILTEAHADRTAKGLLNFLVSEYKLKKLNEETVQPQAQFRVKVKVDELNYRAGAGTEYKINGAIRDKGVYTIVATAKSNYGDTWGKLLSGAGWINISESFVSFIDSVPTVTAPQASFKVRVTVDELNYRAGAGTEHKINGVIKKNEIYTIVDTAKSSDGCTWGKLKSGAGWINIHSKYVSRV